MGEAARYCGRCGALNQTGGSFCGRCGTDLRLSNASQSASGPKKRERSVSLPTSGAAQQAVAVLEPASVAAVAEPTVAPPSSGGLPRYAIAIVVVGGVVGTLMLGSIIYAVVFGATRLQAKGISTLLAIVVTLGAAVCTYLVMRARDQQRPEQRNRDLAVAGLVFGAALFLWLLILILTDRRTSIGGALICLPTTAFAIWVLRRIDRNQKEPWKLVIAAFGWGAVVATNLVMPINGFFDLLLNTAPTPTQAILGGFVPGFAEELSKGAAVVLLFLLMRNEFDDVVDGIVYGALVGLGFNFTETQFYVAAHGVDQLWARQVVGLFFGHVTYTALIGAGLGIARQQKIRWKIGVAIASGFAIAIAAHSTWDALAFLDRLPASNNPVTNRFVMLPIATLLVDGPFLLAVLALLIAGLRNEGQALRRELTLESAAGTGAVLPAEVDVLAIPHRRAAARLAALRGGGVASYEKVRRLQQAQLALAMEMWHRARQEIDSPVLAEQGLRENILKLRRTQTVASGAR